MVHSYLVAQQLRHNLGGPVLEATVQARKDLFLQFYFFKIYNLKYRQDNLCLPAGIKILGLPVIFPPSTDPRWSVEITAAGQPQGHNLFSRNSSLQA